MKYREVKPKGISANFVQCFWEYESADHETEHTILPDGYFDLIAEFENDILSTVKLTGVWTKPVHVIIPKSTTFFAVRFKLLAAEYLFRHEIKSILDTTKKLPFSFWGIDRYQKTDFNVFVAEISKNIETTLKHLTEIDNRKFRLFGLIYESEKNTVSELAADVFWSSRQINRYFNSRFGFPLKEFLKIVRCNASYKDIAGGNLSPQKNFFDQAHFIKELKKYTGKTPKELYKNENGRFLQLHHPKPV